MFTSSLTGGRRARPIPSWAALLARFYEPLGLSVPALDALKADEVPQPYRALLVHSSDMTPTLERFYGQTLRLRVLTREHKDDSYKREVILWLADDALPVEYGVIRIHLERLPTAARRLVLEEKRPLGDILHTEAIPHLSWPRPSSVSNRMLTRGPRWACGTRVSFTGGGMCCSTARVGCWPT